jgi:hypothetical protein
MGTPFRRKTDEPNKILQQRVTGEMADVHHSFVVQADRAEVMRIREASAAARRSLTNGISMRLSFKEGVSFSWAQEDAFSRLRNDVQAMMVAERLHMMLSVPFQMRCDPFPWPSEYPPLYLAVMIMKN